MTDSLFKQYTGVFDEEIIAPKPKQVSGFTYNPFALQDAIGQKSAKEAWVEYQRLRIVENIEAEDLIHKITSKARDMLAINLGASREDLNIKKDYTYDKSKRDAKNWKPEGLKNFYTKLIEAYHRSRLESGNDLDIALEKILINI